MTSTKNVILFQKVCLIRSNIASSALVLQMTKNVKRNEPKRLCY